MPFAPALNSPSQAKAPPATLLPAVAIQCPHSSGVQSATGGSTRNGSNTQRPQPTAQSTSLQPHSQRCSGLYNLLFTPCIMKFGNKKGTIYIVLSSQTNLGFLSLIYDSYLTQINIKEFWEWI
jgi:hypothetical protein